MKDQTALARENKRLKVRLTDAEDLMVAIRSGTVDAIVTDDQKVFTLKGADHAYRILVETMTEGAATLTPDGTVMYCNGRLAEMLGLPIENIVGGKIFDFVEQEELSKLKSILLQGANETQRGEFRIRKKDETLLPVLVACNSLKLENVGLCVIITDLTQQKIAEGSMHAALMEKEVLLKEIHHRVKNNLQVISSLLRLQAARVQDKKTASLFLDSQERVQAMAMVHEFLYKSTDLARIDFPAYVASLVKNLYGVFGLKTINTPPNVDIADVQLSLDVAVPCGLLFTELISNAVKYAYPEGKEGSIDIRFQRTLDGHFELSVADQGIGFPKNFDWMKSDSLGLRLVRILTKQLQGEISMENHRGIKFRITFNDEE